MTDITFNGKKVKKIAFRSYAYVNDHSIEVDIETEPDDDGNPEFYSGTLITR